MSPRSLKKAVFQFLRWAAQRRDPKTIAMHDRYLMRFLASLDHDDLDAVTRLDVETFSIKKHPLESVGAFFRWCVDVAELMHKIPTKGIKVPESGTRERILDRREHVLCQRRASADFRGLQLALRESGARPKEVREMEWEKIHAVDGGCIDCEHLVSGLTYFRLERFKGRDRRTDKMVKRIIPISPRLGRALWRLRRSLTRVSGVIWKTARGRPWTRNALILRFRRLRQKLDRTGEVNTAGLVAYAWRHSFATRLAMKRVAGKILAELMGHSTERLLRRYVHPGVGDLCTIVRDTAATTHTRTVTPRRVEVLDGDA